MQSGYLLGGRYHLNGRIGGGGMSDVWRGQDVKLQREVAVKVLRAGLASDPSFLRRFESEARAIAGLQHEGIVQLHDHGEEEYDGSRYAYLVMEYLPWRPLSRVIAEEAPLSPKRVTAIVAKVADALDAAHLSGVMHRDIKPDNILVDPSSDAIKVIDFGIARGYDDTSLTATGAVMGTLPYASPEQLCDTELSPATDLYSLGVVAYECLSGTRPFTGDTPGIITGHLHREPPPLPDEAPRVLVDAIMRSLAKKPEDRWASAEDMAAALRGLTVDSGPIPIRPPNLATATGAQRTTHSQKLTTAPIKRHRLPLLVSLVLVLILAVTAVVWRPWTLWQPETVGAQENGQSNDEGGTSAEGESSTADKDKSSEKDNNKPGEGEKSSKDDGGGGGGDKDPVMPDGFASELVNADGGLCMAVYGSYTDAEVRMTQWTCIPEDDGAQTFKFDKVEAGYLLKPQHTSDRCVNEYSGQYGYEVFQDQCESDHAWKLDHVKTSGGWNHWKIRMVFYGTTRCLAAASDTGTKGENLRTTSCDGGGPVIWKTPVG